MENIKFINLNDGSVYDGEKPYIHFPFGTNGLSISLPIVGKICFMTNTDNVDISIKENPFYSLIDVSKIENTPDDDIYEFKYKDLEALKTNQLNLSGYIYTENIYIYIVYILANVSEIGEWHDELKIGDNIIEFAGDWYEQDERLCINSSNFGIEIPDAVQKAFYCTNVHEDQTDYIVMNRKLKELLSNYWDILANKGSYKSLYNSLQWFEYGDNKIKLKEIWQHDDFGRITKEKRELKSILEEQYRTLLFAMAKTTYLSLYYAKQEIDDKQYDDEKNPMLKKIASKWSWDDISLKMTLLGNFYKTYFMPIHLDLIHSTIEDIVFTNTIKLIQSSVFLKSSEVFQTETFECNVIDNQLFTIGNVSCQAGPATIFGTKWGGQEWGEQDEAIGVDIIASGQVIDFQSFWINKFGGPGCVVNFKCSLPELKENEVIKRESIVLESEKSGTWIQRESRIIVNSNIIEFNLLFRKEGIKDLRIQFESSLGRLFTKRINIEIRDVKNLCINIYRVTGEIPINFDLNSQVATDYFFTRSYMSQDMWRPVEMYIYQNLSLLNKIYILEKTDLSNDYQDFINNNSNNYFIGSKNTSNNKSYIILLSKSFGNVPEIEIPEGLVIFRSDMAYVPWFHKLLPFGNIDNVTPENESEDMYTMKDGDILWFMPEFLYGKQIEYGEWSFNNVTKNPHMIDYNLPTIRGVFAVAGESKTMLKNGFYDVIFRFKLISESEEHIIILKSAFRKI